MKANDGKYYAPGHGYYGGPGDRLYPSHFLPGARSSAAAVSAAFDKSTMSESKSLSPKRFRHMPFAVPPPVSLIQNNANPNVSAPVEVVDPIHSYLDPISVSLQERVKFGGHITSVTTKPHVIHPYFFTLS